jgi:3-hydroxyacyl-CoA dehydrogenase
MTHRRIQKVAVLGSGVMGSRIACHFANIGLSVLILDILPPELLDQQPSEHEVAHDSVLRNRLVNDSLQAALKSAPSPVFSPNTIKRIRTGNFTDDMKDIASCDWVIEVVVEKLEIKKKIFDQVEKFRRPGTLVTTNTSGIPIHLMTEGRSEDFKRHFCGTHFFNPPRYLQLLEIIPTADTDEDVLNFLMHYGDLYLGKTTVLCKDTPAFIANRVGVFAIMAIFHIMQDLGLNVDEVDALTGPVIGHPKSATFRTCDVVGIDTLVHVADDLTARCPQDEALEWLQVPGFIRRMVGENLLGEKSGAGFYKKEKTGSKSEILTLNLDTFSYGPRSRPRFPALDQVKPLEEVTQRIIELQKDAGKPGAFYREFYRRLFSYVAHRIPEIADDLYKIDDALKSGFGWELGPFELWDLLGVKEVSEQMYQAGIAVPQWVEEMQQRGNTHFYKTEHGQRKFYDRLEHDYKSIPGTKAFIILDHRSENIVWKNQACRIYDIGDDVLCLSWKTKMNTIGGEVLQGVNQAIDWAEKGFSGLIIANEGAVFSAGANIGLIFMLAVEQEWEELHLAVKAFQQATQRIRYSTIPVVVASQGLSLGGGCECCLHADKLQASAETYMGLVEAGVGVIPAGGGTKEFALRASDAYRKGEIELPILQERFLTIAMAKVSTSAEEAVQMGFLRKGHDTWTLNPRRVIAEAKRSVQDMALAGYTAPQPRQDIKVLGREALGAFLAGIHSMGFANRITAHDQKVAQKLAWVMSGGDLSQPTLVSEQYLLDLEREAFVSLCGERKTLERMQSVIKTGKPVRN